ncbi:hypothetical protein F5Y17DRAFT_477742 [Xylariaceae sp. FL0594]|nr:hypothetical protein F5Y17DRAFT_477742 [Xylariaceae sp. FL0594]
MSLAWGAARAIRLEEPQLQLAVFDYDGASSVTVTAGNIVPAYQQAFFGTVQEREFVESHGTLSMSLAGIRTKLSTTRSDPNKLRNHSCPQRRPELVGDEVQVDAKCYGLNAKDNFARFRRAWHLKAVSLALGVVTEAINERELLHLVDLAIAHSHSINDDYYLDYDLAGAHRLTGLEMEVAKAQAMDPSSMAFDILFQDPRAALLKVLEGTSLEDAVGNAMAAKFSNIMMMNTDQLQYEQSLTNLGLDSMLAAEFRTFIFQALQVDIPFVSLLSKTTTFGSVVAAVVDQLAMLKQEHGI